jgi:hypothetical protein
MARPGRMSSPVGLFLVVPKLKPIEDGRMHAEDLVVIAGLMARAEALRGEIEALAEEGDVMGCDLRHGWIGTLERAAAIMSGDVE